VKPERILKLSIVFVLIVTAVAAEPTTATSIQLVVSIDECPSATRHPSGGGAPLGVGG
jgi:hypothetical protein